jgi:hypothetical protein
MAGLSHATATLSLGSPTNAPIEITKPTSSVVEIGANAQSDMVQSLPTSSPLAYHMQLSSKGSNGAGFGTVRVRTLPNGHQAYNGTVSVGALEEVPPPCASVMGSKKKGTIFRCESCSKVYRHPSCLIKHRWEHSPHWKEANKFLLSKHQQVQLLEVCGCNYL